ncbi:hypothetical protein LTS09_018057 [Friedmanniomyces endolithicus]|nr:hypothetical protein LTS09_018057 [Friedmanniomyces endolithicus]
MSIQRDTPCECVIELVRDIRLGTEKNEYLDPLTIRLVHDLCQRLDELSIGQIHTSVDENAERTTVIGVSDAREFTLARLTSSDTPLAAPDTTDAGTADTRFGGVWDDGIVLLIPHGPLVTDAVIHSVEEEETPSQDLSHRRLLALL